MGKLKSKLLSTIGLLVFLAAVLVPSIAPILAIQHAQAAGHPTGPVIYYNENIFTIYSSDGKIWVSDTTPELYMGVYTSKYIKQGDTGKTGKSADCKDFITSMEAGTATLYITSYKSDTGCTQDGGHSIQVQGSVGLSISEPTKAEWASDGHLYYWVDKNTISRFAYGSVDSATYIRKSGNTFLEDTTSQCKDKLVINSGNTTASYYSNSEQADEQDYYSIMNDPTGDVKPQYNIISYRTATGSCYSGNKQEPDGSGGVATVFVSLSAINSTRDKPADDTTPVDPGGGSGGGSGGNTSEDACQGGIPVLGWIICSIADLTSKFAGYVDTQIQNLLEIDSSTYSSGQGTNLKTAWSAVRILSTIALVGIALFMIIAQIFNFEFVSAYTIKKLMPRLVIAIILMQLSWFLFTAAIDLINILGRGVSDLIAAPFGGADQLKTIGGILSKYYAGTGSGDQLGAFSITAFSVATGFMLVGGGFGLLAMALPILAAVLIAFVTLVLRKVIIVALLIIAPLAIVAWILPNTQNLWKKYWSLFTKLLFMFPLIAGLLMVGKVFAMIAASTKTNGTINFFIILVAYFGPFFFIPSMLKASGGVLGKTYGAMNKLGSGLSKQGGQWVKTRGQSWASNRYQPGAKGFGGRLNNIATRVGTGNLSPTRRGRASLAAAGLEYSQKQNQQAAALVASQLSSQDFKTQGNTLVELAQHRDRRIRDTALRQIANSGRFGLLDQVEAARPGTTQDLADRDGEFGATVAKKRRDLVGTPTIPEMSTQDLADMHDTFWASPHAAMADPNALAELISNPLYSGRLGDRGRTFAAAHMTATRAGATPAAAAAAGAAAAAAGATPATAATAGAAAAAAYTPAAAAAAAGATARGATPAVATAAGAAAGTTAAGAAAHETTATTRAAAAGATPAQQKAAGTEAAKAYKKAVGDGHNPAAATAAAMAASTEAARGATPAEAAAAGTDAATNYGRTPQV